MSFDDTHPERRRFTETLFSPAQVNASSGSVSFSHTIIQLAGTSTTLDLHLQLHYSSADAKGALGLPNHWSFGIDYIEAETLFEDGMSGLTPPPIADLKSDSATHNAKLPTTCDRTARNYYQVQTKNDSSRLYAARPFHH